ncbi:MAG: PCYCGC motif-containing (lipo)protein [Chloroflexota bacterium]|nr:MAG: hypothetical protein DIU68_08340 [Chloroflexota bacterium]
MFRRPVFWAVTVLVLAGGILALVSATQTSESGVALPDRVRHASHRVVQAYEYAVTHPGEVAKYPCYCGCGPMGHTSNLSCYLSGFNGNGDPVWDYHALGCGICVDITLDVKRLRDEGWSSPDIRQYIDARYGRFGPGTNTPLPLS